MIIRRVEKACVLLEVFFSIGKSAIGELSLFVFQNVKIKSPLNVNRGNVKKFKIETISMRPLFNS